MIEHGNYLIEILEPQIGSGGQGKVNKINLYNRRGELCKGNYAIKTLLNQDDIDNLRQRFIREIRIQANLYHNNIVPIYLYNMTASEPWFVMQLADDSLDKILKNKKVNDNEIITAFLDLLKGLSFIHSKGLLHRDMKPSNILKVGNTYKITDFGLVRAIDPNLVSEKLTAVNCAVGTLDYMSPESRFGQYSEQSDIYSVGIILEYIYQQYPTINSEFLSVIEKCTKREPRNRYQYIDEIIKEIQYFIDKDIKNA